MVNQLSAAQMDFFAAHNVHWAVGMRQMQLLITGRVRFDPGQEQNQLNCERTHNLPISTEHDLIYEIMTQKPDVTSTPTVQRAC